MFDITTMNFPVLAFTPNGVMPYSEPDNLLRCMAHEYDLGWYNQLELVDSSGGCAVVESAKIVKEPVLARVLGRMVEVKLVNAAKLTDYDTAATKDRVIEFLSIYPDMYQTAGVYDEILNKVNRASSTREVVMAFLQ